MHHYTNKLKFPTIRDQLYESWFALSIRTDVSTNCWYGMYWVVPSYTECTDTYDMGRTDYYPYWFPIRLVGTTRTEQYAVVRWTFMNIFSIEFY